MRLARSLLIGTITLSCSAAEAHTWQSAVGGKTLEAAFLGVKGKQVLLQGKEGKPTAFALELFSAEDQQFAHVAQRCVEEAAKSGSRTFQISQPLDHGALAKMGSEMVAQKGKWIFTGTQFMLMTAGDTLLRRDQRFDAQTLYACGTRTFWPLEGEPTVIPAYSMDLETAAKWQQHYERQKGGGLPPEPEALMEPIVEIAQTYGLGLPVGPQLLITDAALVKDSQSILMHVEQKDVPVTVVKVDTKLGVAVLRHSAELEPGRFALRKPPELGQPIYSVAMELAPGRKGFLSSPSLTKGIISKLRSGGAFLHDAARAPYSIGGYVLSEKGDVLGAYFSSSTRLESKQTGISLPPPPPADEKEGELAECVRTDALERLLADIPGSAALKALSVDELPLAIKTLKQSSVLVVSTRELRRAPPPRKKAQLAQEAGAQAGGAKAATGFSISKTGLRHNAQCKFYRPDYPCEAAAGKPCKVCGG
jgi:hypothetical protein